MSGGHDAPPALPRRAGPRLRDPRRAGGARGIELIGRRRSAAPESQPIDVRAAAMIASACEIASLASTALKASAGIPPGSPFG